MKNGEPTNGEPRNDEPRNGHPVRGDAETWLTALQRRRDAARRRARRAQGFTLLELIIVIAIIGILASIAMPNLIGTPRRAKEAVLKTNLRTLREVIDQHYGDKGSYPPSLEALVEEGYLRDVPVDPMTGESEWGEVFDTDLGGDDGIDPVESDLADGEGGEAGIIDVFSLSPETSIDGEPYGEW